MVKARLYRDVRQRSREFCPSKCRSTPWMSDQKLSATIFDERGGQQTLPASKSTLVVGRASHCDIVLNHSSVYAEHVRAWLEGGRIWLQDLGSEAGTFLNGTRLPTLKPMLVRDVDLIKLGTCPATIGFDIQSPRETRVRLTPTPESEPISTEVRPTPSAEGADLDRRRVEIARAGRELAELKLQLQMARLDKGAGEDVRRKLLAVREEVAAAEGRREQIKREIHRLQEQRQMALSQTRAEVAAKLEAAERDISEMRDRAGRRLGHWKVDVISQLERGLREMTEAKARAWVTRPLSRDMILEWAGELDQLIRSVVLEDTGHGTLITTPEETRTFTLIPKPDFFPDEPESRPPNEPPPLKPTVAKPVSAETSIANPVIPAHPKISVSENLDRTNHAEIPPPAPPAGMSQAMWKRLKVIRNVKLRDVNLRGSPKRVVIGASLAILACAALTKKLRPASSPRNVAGVSSPNATPHGMPSPDSSLPATPSIGTGKSGTNHFKPRQTRTFKPTFVENMLFTEHYEEIENDPRYRTQWMAELNRVALGAWHLNGGVVTKLGNKEQALIRTLSRSMAEDSPSLGATMLKLQAIETQFQGEMNGLIGPKIYAQFMALKRANYGRFRPSDH